VLVYFLSQATCSFHIKPSTVVPFAQLGSTSCIVSYHFNEKHSVYHFSLFLCFRLVNFTAQFSVSIAVILMPNFLCHYNAHVITIKQFLVSCIIIRICLAQLFHYTFAAICHALLKSFECRFMFALVYMPHLIHRLVSSIVTSLDLRCSCLYAVGFSLQRRRSGLLMGPTTELVFISQYVLDWS
jgi:hypothetical protein